jgi:hypothetical protein
LIDDVRLICQRRERKDRQRNKQTGRKETDQLTHGKYVTVAPVSSSVPVTALAGYGLFMFSARCPSRAAKRKSSIITSQYGERRIVGKLVINYGGKLLNVQHSRS